MARVSDAVDTILEQWAVERPELDRDAMGVLGRIARLAKAFDAEYAKVFASFGIRPDEFDVLATLRRHGAPFALCPRDLLSTMMVASGTLTNRIDKLERAGLVRRVPDPADRRSIDVQLTPKGRRLVDRAVEAHVARQAELLAPLQPHEVTELTGLLRRLAVDREGIPADPTP